MPKRVTYKQMVLPFFDYLDILIDGGTRKYLDKLQALQFRGIKIVYQYCIDGRRITNKDELQLHQNLNLAFLEDRRKKHLLKMMFDFKTRKPEYVIDQSNRRNLRSN